MFANTHSIPFLKLIFCFHFLQSDGFKAEILILLILPPYWKNSISICMDVEKNNSESFLQKNGLSGGFFSQHLPNLFLISDLNQPSLSLKPLPLILSLRALVTTPVVIHQMAAADLCPQVTLKLWASYLAVPL